MASLINSAGATGSGSMTIQGPNTNSNQVLTIPDATGTAMVSGNMPAFNAYTITTQTIATNTFTKIQYNVKTFDTNTNYDNTTNYRFTPTVAGYYQINGNFAMAGAASGYCQIAIYKNGGQVASGSGIPNNTNVGGMCFAGTVLFLNGSTDYVEIYGWQNSGGNLGLQTSTGFNTFSGVMVRAA